jgi:hypothetical protein
MLDDCGKAFVLYGGANPKLDRSLGQVHLLFSKSTALHSLVLFVGPELTSI